MFSWHETTLRGLCRLAFGLLVVVPTCAVLSAIVWCHCPLSVEYYRRALAEQLALDVRLDRVSFPRPSVTRFQGLSLADPETNRPLAEFPELVWQTSGQTSSVHCPRAELMDSGRLDLLTELVARRLRLFAGAPAVVEIDAEQLTLHLADGGAPQTLTQVRGRLHGPPGKPPADGARSEPQGTVEFHLADQEKGAPARVTFYRTRSPSRATTSMKIDTGPTALPARLVELFCPGWETWGSESTFCGELWWQQRADGLAGEVSGTIAGVDLDKLVSSRSEHRLSGLAEVELEKARFQRGRLLDAVGSVHAGPGLVRRSLLAAAAIQLHFTGNNPAAAWNDLAPYDEMAFHFAIDERGLRIQGLCSQSPGAVLMGRVHGQLLGEPAGPLGEPIGPQPLLGVVRLLADLGDAVPADPAAQALLGVLPPPLATPRSIDPPVQARRNKDSNNPLR
ncbi:MAG TPA: hypothetical protein VHY91_17815 [Pirellulales bacterium]|jgi:hypothetical protein|nr:hypothetical protein [Pirellulales bacterium]